MSVEAIVLATCLYFGAVTNAALWQVLAAGFEQRGHDLFVAAGAFTVITAVHFLLLAPWLGLRTVKPVLTLLLFTAAITAHYMTEFGVHLDTSMLQNVMQTDVTESRELLSWRLAYRIGLLAGVPATLLWTVRLRRRRRWHALGSRLAWSASVLAVAVVAGLAIYPDLAAQVRNHREIRYLVNPASLLASLGRLVVSESSAARLPRAPVGLDARVVRRGRTDKPLLLVVVVGETVRAANWGLSGYARQTTPRLAELGVINFKSVRACGSSTAVSLPCMFSATGRHDYDERRIRSSESLLHVVGHAGITVLWRDNQAGCKGVCDGLEFDQVQPDADPGLCDGERCLDEVLLSRLDETIRARQEDLLVVLHPLGNHGPAYFRRYPKEFHHFRPACGTTELNRCSRQEIVNAYDNAVLYTDHFLASTIAMLEALDSHHAAMLYVSDHGESLGEAGLYLHGLPWAIAPAEQLEVPMVAWVSHGFSPASGLDLACLEARATMPLSHDFLFHSVLGLMGILTAVYDPAYDFSAPCRAGTGSRRADS